MRDRAKHDVLAMHMQDRQAVSHLPVRVRTKDEDYCYIDAAGQTCLGRLTCEG